MDQKQIIHIASEVVVISGLAIYFKLKTNSLSTQVEELKKRIITQEQLIEDFKNRLDDHSLLFSKQEQLLKQCLKNQTQASSHSPYGRTKSDKQKSRSPKEIGIVWDSDNDSSYFPEKSVKSKKVSTEQKLSPPINRVRGVIRPQVVEEKRVENVRVRHRVVEEDLQRNRVGPPIIENLDEQRNRVGPPLENLDEELENELLELERPDSEHSDSEIIEIDTSLKKKA